MRELPDTIIVGLHLHLFEALVICFAILTRLEWEMRNTCQEVVEVFSCERLAVLEQIELLFLLLPKYGHL
jgi:hypothetical protein